jgi:DUF917 family protein
MNMKAFTDEMLKIASAGWPVEAGRKIFGGLGGKGMAIALPATAIGSVLGWEKLKQMKRRYDIGKMVEDSQARRG